MDEPPSRRGNAGTVRVRASMSLALLTTIHHPENESLMNASMITGLRLLPPPKTKMRLDRRRLQMHAL